MKSFLKKILFPAIALGLMTGGANAWQLESQRTLGSGQGANQNVSVKCTTAAGKVASQSCNLRRYAKCNKTASGAQSCNGWQPWTDIRNPGRGFSTWQSAADSCCRAKGLK